ncbi:MAG: PilZ domain-containing protein [Janthinobacterium lividum]
MSEYDDIYDTMADGSEDDVEAALRRQDEALALLERLRITEPSGPKSDEAPGGGRRDFRRWPAPEGITVHLHDGSTWQPAPSSDLGVGGARLNTVPAWLLGPVPVRLQGVTGPAVLTLGDLVWRDSKSGAAGLRFEFSDAEEHDRWTAILIDALLARYALGQ